MKLTAKAVEKIKHEGTGYRDVSDDAAAGLYLRVLASGRKSWVYRWKVRDPRDPSRWKPRVFTIADVRDMTLAEAREEAAELRRKVRKGIDLVAERQRAERDRFVMPTVEDFADEYVKRYAKPNKKTWERDEYLLNREVVPAIGRLKLDDVHRRDLVALVDRIADRGALVQSNRVLAVVRRMFRFAVERGVIESSPCVNIPSVREEARERVLSDEEIKRLWDATEAPGEAEMGTDAAEDGKSVGMLPSTRLALRLLLLTGARAGEVCGITPAELEKDRWILPASRSKNGLSHVVPLSPAAAEVLDDAVAMSGSDEWVFPAARGGGSLTVYGLGQALARIFEDQPDRPRVHDIRRTVGTRLTELGFNRLVVDKVLNHKDRTVGGIYDRHSYDAEKRQALEGWARKLDQIITGLAADNVVEIGAQNPRVG